MKIGLFFGSFNPIHIGHLIISAYFINFFADKIWFVVSPHNPFKDSSELLGINERLMLVNSAIKGNKDFEVSDVELNLPLPSYTINTLNHLKTVHPEHDYFVIMGSDNFLNLSKWKSADVIQKNYKFLIYQRPGFVISTNNLSKNSTVVNAPLINISSTEIRDLIKAQKSIRYLVPDSVLKLIENNKFYL